MIPPRRWTVADIEAANRAAQARDLAILHHEIWLYGSEIVGLYLLLEVERLLECYGKDPA